MTETFPNHTKKSTQCGTQCVWMPDTGKFVSCGYFFNCRHVFIFTVLGVVWLTIRFGNKLSYHFWAVFLFSMRLNFAIVGFCWVYVWKTDFKQGKKKSVRCSLRCTMCTLSKCIRMCWMFLLAVNFLFFFFKFLSSPGLLFHFILFCFKTLKCLSWFMLPDTHPILF